MEDGATAPEPMGKVVPLRVAAQLRRQGMTVETVEGTGHTVFRDDHAGFMDTVVGWLRGVAKAQPQVASVAA